MSDSTPPPYGDQSGSTPPPPPPSPYDGGQAAGYPAQPAAAVPYASWFQRVGAYLVDAMLSIPAVVVIFIGLSIAAAGAETTTDPATGVTSLEGGNPAGVVVAVLGYVGIFVIYLWNTVFRQGRTGYSVGKQALGIKLIKEDSGQPMGAGMSFVRQIAHILDGLVCYIGYLWPLWDTKRQTFADKIMSTVVIQQPKS